MLNSTDRPNAGAIFASQVLATDLDGTLIPLTGNTENLAALERLSKAFQRSPDRSLVYVSGRHLESIQEAINKYGLPEPNWIIADVGASIYEKKSNAVGASSSWRRVSAYSERLDQICEQQLPGNLIGDITKLEIASIRPQESNKQGRHKLSFYTKNIELDEASERISEFLVTRKLPFSLISSIDPFNQDGLIDLLPKNVSKAFALDWWAKHSGTPLESIIYAGDSGNDLAAFRAGYRTIIVGNAQRSICQEVVHAHQVAGFRNRLFLAKEKATCGVVEGCQWFELFGTPQLQVESNFDVGQGSEDQTAVAENLAYDSVDYLAASPVDGSANTDSIETVLPERLGAMPVSFQTVDFLVWAPKQERVSVRLGLGDSQTDHPMTKREDGYHFSRLSGVIPGTRYQFCLENGIARPDPASRFQPTSVHLESEVVSDAEFVWTDQDWVGEATQRLVIYELHVGTFTEAGTFLSAIEKLDELVELGINAVELMPLAACPGKWNWGYDGVNLFAVNHNYGTPNELRQFVDACHQRRLSVIVDVVYNHLGPEGNYLSDFAPYFTNKFKTPWGETPNFGGRHAVDVRRFFIENVLMWLREYHIDGLRLDAVHFLFDESNPHILSELREAALTEEHRLGRQVHMIAEANVFDESLQSAGDSSEGYSAIWCDCLMHSIYSHASPQLNVTHREYLGADDLTLALKQGYVYQGPPPERVGRRESSTILNSSKEPATAKGEHLDWLIIGLQTHDSIGNHPHGKRLHQLTSVQFQKAAAPLVLLFPGIPILFMGEEQATSAHFPFFVDFEDVRLRKAVDRGRAREYPQHEWDGALSPSDPQAFRNAKLSAGTSEDPTMLEWYRGLLGLRKEFLAKGIIGKQNYQVLEQQCRSLFGFAYQDEDGERLEVRCQLGPLTESEKQWLEPRGEVRLEFRSEFHSAVVLASQPTPR